jgi:pimeloyl-ACP methyl ester carboxylesterase
VPFHYANTVQKHIPDLRLVTIPDAPHDLPQSHPEQVLDALDEFFRG